MAYAPPPDPWHGFLARVVSLGCGICLGLLMTLFVLWLGSMIFFGALLREFSKPAKSEPLEPHTKEVLKPVGK